MSEVLLQHHPFGDPLRRVTVQIKLFSYEFREGRFSSERDAFDHDEMHMAVPLIWIVLLLESFNRSLIPGDCTIISNILSIYDSSTANFPDLARAHMVPAATAPLLETR